MMGKLALAAHLRHPTNALYDGQKASLTLTILGIVISARDHSMHHYADEGVFYFQVLMTTE